MSPSAEPPVDPSSGPSPLRLLSQALAPLSQCACAYDSEGRCLFANRSFGRWLGRDEAELIGRSLDELWPVPFAAREAADLRQALAVGRLELLEVRPGLAGMRQVRAVKYPWHGEVPAAPGQPAEVVVVVFEEVGPVPGLAQPEQLGWLALGIVHDFNNALTMIRGEVEMLTAALAGGQERLRDLHQLLDHASQLPRQLLAFARKEPPRSQVVDLHTLLRSLEGLLRSRMAGSIRLEYRLDPGGAWIEGDPVQLTQAFLNLTGNALDAMVEGGQLLIETVRQGTTVQVHLQDTGPGIPPGTLERIFEPLYTMRPGGTGLGLVVVREVVRRHHGSIRCTSEPGHGTRFTLELPLSTGQGSEADSSAPETALVVDPDPEVRQLSALILEQTGYRVQRWAQVPGVEELPERVEMMVVDASLLHERGHRALEACLQQSGAGLVVTVAGAMPPLSPLCQGRLRGLVSKPYSAEVLLNTVRQKAGR